MTDAPRKAALQDLLADVEAGRLPDNLVSAEPFCGTDFKVGQDVVCAYIGSLDAAKALHEALIPGWSYNLAPGFCHAMPPHDNEDQEEHTGVDDNLSRAWLIAILKALIAKEEASHD